ncbi:cyclodeaminase/cyclohydrolase family protein [Deinococcus sp. YIM 77859]|uniref:cyclodeaminase/cyclohydrolase family protein n=1 Tax=Deinococcus sp. YIM 77859 TaxID=1540221 RepID=UPI000550F802|nr:cyclodeaminase/cyclohydrolase family protein [Deinococcus sp. YIM 77859]
MASLWQRPALDLLQEAASGAPTPGGGATAALTGAFGVALLEMALHITLNKDERAAEALRPVLPTLSALRARLQTLVEEDVQAFEAYVRAAHLPQDTGEERREREEARTAAGEASMRTPRHLARTLVEALEEAPRLVPQVHPEVTSDVGAGAAILEGALHAALLTVTINLPHVPQEERDALQAERDTLEARGRERAAQTLRLTRERLAGRS